MGPEVLETPRGPVNPLLLPEASMTTLSPSAPIVKVDFAPSTPADLKRAAYFGLRLPIPTVSVELAPLVADASAYRARLDAAKPAPVKLAIHGYVYEVKPIPI